MDVEIESRVERLNQMVSEGRIIRNGWFGTDEQGRETACLLAALSPEAGESENADFCPAAVMPAWFAHLTPWMDDACSDAEWPRVVRRYAACAARWSALDDAAWRRVEIATRRVAVVEAMRHTSDEQVLDACRDVLDWLDSDMPESSRAAERAAVAAAWATMEARAAATGAAEKAEKSAAEAWRAWAASTESAAKAAAWRSWAASTESAAHWARAAARAESAESAAGAAMAAAAAAKAAARARSAASAAAAAVAAVEAAASESATEAAAAARITDTILAALEQECLAVR